MNEKQFVKCIQSKENIISALNKLLQDIEKQKKFTWRQRRTQKAKTIISNNLIQIIEHSQYDQTNKVLKILIENPNTNDLIKEKLEEILKVLVNKMHNARHIKDGVIETLTQKYLVQSIKMLLDIQENEDKLMNEVEYIIKYAPISYLWDLIQKIKGKSQIIDDRLNDTIKNNLFEVVKALLIESIGPEAEWGISREQILIRDKKYVKECSAIINTLIKRENVKYIDINLIKRGNFSSVYSVGTKVLKIGLPRAKYDIPEHEKIGKSKKIEFLDETNKPLACIEVMDKADTSIKMGEEDLYELYKALRMNHIVWTDVKPENAGLIDNKLVIIDKDYIYLEGAQDIEYPCGRAGELARKLEKRYIQEQTQEIADKHFKLRDNNRINGVREWQKSE